jgi:hypothetical protein
LNRKERSRVYSLALGVKERVIPGRSLSKDAKWWSVSLLQLVSFFSNVQEEYVCG